MAISGIKKLLFILFTVFFSWSLTAQTSSLIVTEMDGTNIGFRINGESNDYLGYANHAADVNGDGYDDVILSGRSAYDSNFGSGRVYVFFGKSGGFTSGIEPSDLDGSNGFIIQGLDITNQRAGESLASGDINGDNVDDIVIGAPGLSTVTSKVYVLFGKTSDWSASVEISSLDGSDGFVVEGEFNGDNLGWDVASGDINNDGKDEVIMGAFTADYSGADAGAVYVLYGKSSNYSSTVNAEDISGSAGFVLHGATAGDQFGGNVFSIDINNDNYDEILASSPSANEPGGGANDTGLINVIYGKSSSYSDSINVSEIDGSIGFNIIGEGTNDLIGGIGGGNINGDDYQDIIIGDADSYVVYGKGTAFSANFDLGDLDGSNGFKIDHTGLVIKQSEVVASGDINGDGYDEVMIGGSQSQPNGSGSGSIYIIYGGSSLSDPTTLNDLNGENGFKLDGAAAGWNVGRNSIGVGDINNDGFTDIVAGAYGSTTNGSSSGSSFVYLNSNNQTITGDEGFRMLSAPASGKLFNSMLAPYWTQGPANSDAEGDSDNVWFWNQSSQSWSELTDQNTDSLEAGQGFLFYVYSDDDHDEIEEGFPKSISSVGAFANVQDVTVNSGSITIFNDLDQNDYYLAGNPYVSTIDWDAVSGWTKTNVSNVIFIWSDADTDWKQWNGSSGDLGDGVIAPYQGFFVHSVGGTGTLSVTEDVISGSASLLKSGGKVNQDNIVLVLNQSDRRAKAYIDFHPEGNIELDRFDGYLLESLSDEYLQIGTSYNENSLLKINSISKVLEHSLLLDLHIISTNGEDEITLGFENIDDLDAYKFSLIDREKDITIPVTSGLTLKVEGSIEPAKKVTASKLSTPKQSKAKGVQPRYALQLTPLSSVGNETIEKPLKLSLSQNYPNPFNPSTLIKYSVPKSGIVTLSVYNLTGQKVADLVQNYQVSGEYEVEWNASEMSSGIYYYRLESSGKSIINKMTLIK